MIQNKVSPSSAASSPTHTLALLDAALSMSLSSPRYVPHSHDGNVAAHRTSTVMQHGSGSPAATSQQTPGVRTLSSQKASKRTSGVRNVSSKEDSPPRPSARSLAHVLPSKQRARLGSIDGSTHSGQGSPYSHVRVLSSHSIPDTLSNVVVTKISFGFSCAFYVVPGCCCSLVARSPPVLPAWEGREGRERPPALCRRPPLA